ncbi:MAG: ATP-binding cassette domain-containing protein [Prevotella sp.]
MDKITFDHVVPHVFSGDKTLSSDVWDNQISFEKGNTYLVEASSGKGKSTFCSYILCQRHDFDGHLYFDNRDASSLSVRDVVALRQRHVSHLFQELRLFPELTAMENVEIKNSLYSQEGVKGFRSRQEINEWFEALGLSSMRDKLVGKMSFGQQQRVAMVRALVQPFDFLVVDEPISHLDDDNARIMADIILAEVSRQGAGLITTSIGRHWTLGYDCIVKL